MKLLFCSLCKDVRKLDYVVVVCNCGAARGRYLADGWAAEVNSSALLFGLNNTSVKSALQQARDGDKNPALAAWLMNDNPRVSVNDKL